MIQLSISHIITQNQDKAKVFLDFIYGSGYIKNSKMSEKEKNIAK